MSGPGGGSGAVGGSSGSSVVHSDWGGLTSPWPLRHIPVLSAVRFRGETFPASPNSMPMSSCQVFTTHVQIEAGIPDSLCERSDTPAQVGPQKVPNNPAMARPILSLARITFLHSVAVPGSLVAAVLPRSNGDFTGTGSRRAKQPGGGPVQERCARFAYRGSL